MGWTYLRLDKVVETFGDKNEFLGIEILHLLSAAVEHPLGVVPIPVCQSRQLGNLFDRVAIGNIGIGYRSRERFRFRLVKVLYELVKTISEYANSVNYALRNSPYREDN